ncbi:hypothetical protein PHISP_00467 [Aspergillus sp. HF37]|nr:hypothetical protein PHISP_00467 [Aspergillus sp. HF37]
MEDPRQQSTPPRAKKGNKSRNKKNGRASNGQPQQSSPKLDSSPSSTSANRNVSNGMHSQDHNHHADCDTISNASLESSKSPGRRRRARGGRKSRSKLHIASQHQQDAGVSDTQADQQLRDAENELYGYDDLPGSRTGEQDKGQNFGADASASGTEDYEQKQDEQQSDTGIRAFNARRADPKGRQPVWMKVQRNSENAAATQDQNHHEDRPGQQSSKPQEPPQQGRFPRISVKQAAPGQGDAKEGSQGQQQQEKEVSIKFDLNLELELALKAKVKGEIMVTFL